MSYLDFIATDEESEFFARLRNVQDADRSGPCEDSDEAVTELMAYLPEESGHEGGSPLDFGKAEPVYRPNWDNRSYGNSAVEIDRKLYLACKQGW